MNNKIIIFPLESGYGIVSLMQESRKAVVCSSTEEPDSRFFSDLSFRVRDVL